VLCLYPGGAAAIFFVCAVVGYGLDRAGIGAGAAGVVGASFAFRDVTALVGANWRLAWWGLVCLVAVAYYLAIWGLVVGVVAVVGL
jgi:hypothetical protein